MTKMIVVDGNNWFRRKAESNTTGTPVRDCFNELQTRTLDNVVIVVWDGFKSLTARRALYPEYKAGRNKPTEGFFEVQKLFKQLLEFTAVTQVEVSGYEGDDVVAAIVSHYRNRLPIIIESNDADFGQLGVPTTRPTPLPEVPHRMNLYKTMVGDASDNIGGCKGFGKVTWARMTDAQKDMLGQVLLSGHGLNDDERRERLQDFFPKGALTWFMEKENRELLLTFYKIVNFIPIPWEEVEKNMKAGLGMPELAEPIFAEFMQ